MTFTHKIDRRIDLEREKVVNDLVFANCAEQAQMVERPLPLGQARPRKNRYRRTALGIVIAGGVRGFLRPGTPRHSESAEIKAGKGRAPYDAGRPSIRASRQRILLGLSSYNVQPHSQRPGARPHRIAQTTVRERDSARRSKRRISPSHSMQRCDPLASRCSLTCDSASRHV